MLTTRRGRVMVWVATVWFGLQIGTIVPFADRAVMRECAWIRRPTGAKGNVNWTRLSPVIDFICARYWLGVGWQRGRLLARPAEERRMQWSGQHTPSPRHKVKARRRSHGEGRGRGDRRERESEVNRVLHGGAWSPCVMLPHPTTWPFVARPNPLPSSIVDLIRPPHSHSRSLP